MPMCKCTWRLWRRLVERKKLKNIRYFASSKLSYEELWEVVFDYVDKKYDIDKFKKIFVSGDGATGIKNYKNCFPNAKFVLDTFHYIRRHLNYIFKEILHQYDELTLPITKSFLGIKSAFIDTIFYSYCCTSIENFEEIRFWI